MYRGEVDILECLGSKIIRIIVAPSREELAKCRSLALICDRSMPSSMQSINSIFWIVDLSIVKSTNEQAMNDVSRQVARATDWCSKSHCERRQRKKSGLKFLLLLNVHRVKTLYIIDEVRKSHSLNDEFSNIVAMKSHLEKLLPLNIQSLMQDLSKVGPEERNGCSASLIEFSRRIVPEIISRSARFDHHQ